MLYICVETPVMMAVGNEMRYATTHLDPTDLCFGFNISTLNYGCKRLWLLAQFSGEYKFFSYQSIQWHPPRSRCLRNRGRYVSCLCPRHKVTWCGLARGRSVAERTTLMWVRAIDKGPAQQHADSDLLPENLNARENGWIETALFFSSSML